MENSTKLNAQIVSYNKLTNLLIVKYADGTIVNFFALNTKNNPATIIQTQEELDELILKYQPASLRSQSSNVALLKILPKEIVFPKDSSTLPSEGI